MRAVRSGLEFFRWGRLGAIAVTAMCVSACGGQQSRGTPDLSASEADPSTAGMELQGRWALVDTDLEGRQAVNLELVIDSVRAMVVTGRLGRLMTGNSGFDSRMAGPLNGDLEGDTITMSITLEDGTALIDIVGAVTDDLIDVTEFRLSGVSWTDRGPWQLRKVQSQD